MDESSLTDEVYHYIFEYPNQSPEFYCKKFGLDKKEFAKIIRWLGRRELVKYDSNRNIISIGIGENGR